mgnify:CR=1 FL=1
MSKVVSWNTTKTADGFAWTVYSFGYQLPTEVLKAGHCPTRAQATLRAKKWTRFIKSEQRAQAA